MKEELIKYVMAEADKCYADDFPIYKIETWIREFFDSYQPERSKREDLIESCNHKNDLHEYREKSGRCFDPLCYSCKDAVL